jgi:hypothetical protein
MGTRREKDNGLELSINGKARNKMYTLDSVVLSFIPFW